MKNTFKNTVFLRLFLMFVAILIILCGIGVNIYNWGVVAIRNEISKSMVSQVDFYKNSLNTEIQRIKLLQYECVSDDDLNDLVFATQLMNDYEKNKSMLRLQKRLITIKSSSRYIDDVSASIIGLDTTISANNGVIRGIDESEQKIVKTPYISSLSQIVQWNGDLYLNMTYPMTYMSSNKILYIIKIKLNASAFAEDLNQFITYENSISMMSFNSSEILLMKGQLDNIDDGMRDVLIKKIKKIERGSNNETIGGEKYLAVHSTSEYIGVRIARYIPERAVMSSIKNYQIWLWIFSIVSLIVIAIFSIYIYSFIHKPVQRLMRAFKAVENGDLKVYIEHNHNDEFRYIYREFNMMVVNLNTLIDQVYKQKILMQNAQLKQLQAQINPHFLYNTFFILYSIARTEDYENLMSFLQQLGNYFKFITRNSEDEVPLSKEVEHARTYTNIQGLRFSKRISIEFEELPEKFENLIVPRLIIQPIIENSFKYGLEDKTDKGVLAIRFHEFGSFFCIIIEDNGNGMNRVNMSNLNNVLKDSDYEGEATGVVNIHKRLQLKFGKNSGLNICKSEIGGLKVVIRIEQKENSDV